MLSLGEMGIQLHITYIPIFTCWHFCQIITKYSMKCAKIKTFIIECKDFIGAGCITTMFPKFGAQIQQHPNYDVNMYPMSCYVTLFFVYVVCANCVHVCKASQLHIRLHLFYAQSYLYAHTLYSVAPPWTSTSSPRSYHSFNCVTLINIFAIAPVVKTKTRLWI